MAMNDGSSSTISASNPARASRRARRGSTRRSFKTLGGLLGNGSCRDKIAEELGESSQSEHSFGGDASSRSSSFGDRLSFSMPGFRHRGSEEVGPFGDIDKSHSTNNNPDAGEGEEEEETVSPLIVKQPAKGLVPSLRRAVSLQTENKKSKEESNLLRPPSLMRAISLQTDTFSIKRVKEEDPIPPPPNMQRSISGSILKRAARATRPSRPRRKASPPKSSKATDIPELTPCLETTSNHESISFRGRIETIPTSSLRGSSSHLRPTKTVTISPSVSISPPKQRRERDNRERSKSPFRRTRSTPDAPTVLLNAKGQPINFEEYEDMSESTYSQHSQSPKRSQSPLRRSVSNVLSTSPKAKGTLNKADLAPRIPLTRGQGRATTLASPRDLAPRMPALNRGRSLGTTAASLALKRKGGGGSPSPNSDSPSRRVPTRRSSGKSVLTRSGSTAAFGRGVRATKSACSDLAAMQLALGKVAVKTTVKTTALGVKTTARGVTGGSAAIMGGLRATKSACADLAEMQKALGVARIAGATIAGAASSGISTIASGTSLSSNNSMMISEVEPDPMFVEMMQWNPLDPDDRAKYDDVNVRRQIRRNPDALKAKYNVQMGRSTVIRSPLSTIIALGASLETVRAAIKAHPEGLRASSSLRTTPLHTACSFDTDILVVRYLYHKYPGAIASTTKHVFLPLHNACQMAEPNLEMIKFLVECYPEGLTEINKLGDTPLRIAERNEATPEEVLEYLEVETERVFSQCEENELKRKDILARQSWGSKELILDALQMHMDDTDHTTISTALLEESEHSTSEEFSSEFNQNPAGGDNICQQAQQPMVSLLDT